MDESTVDALGGLPEGFAGQRMVVVPRPTVRAARARPVTNRLVVTDAGFFPHAARHGRSRPDGAREHVLLVCTAGAGWCRTPDGRFDVRPGDVVLVPARTPHEYAADRADPWTLWWLHATGPDADELATAVGDAAGGPVSHLRDPATVASLVSQAIDALDDGTAGGLVRAAGAAWHALAHVVATGRRSPGPAPDPVERAVEHLRATAPRRTSVGALAAMVGLSTSQLGALFRAQVGTSPLQYQTGLRLARARELLDATDLPVAAVAQACGYDDPLYFSRRFTRTHGMSPSAYRGRDV
ncbi:AraC family transcriptional regulator [Isoptericola sp. S6320L]|uniref:AraC family transcriptional regulator n=1 Tax=Isoptericola sp. S6320L TaxID=2926411 RepID=UPI001FF10AB6|nr:AraC family transcriptional regulator [Isoptericola sp. S6320L]MCK0115980.1 AraC family transcriptional regulator [Isoptericola sp. S6320L]